MEKTLRPLFALLLSVFLIFTTNAAAEKRTEPLKGRALLIATVENRYPPLKFNLYDCETIIPSFKNIRFDGGCRLNQPKEPETIFIGDSHTGHYRSVILSRFSSHPTAVIEQTSCLPFGDQKVMSRECREKHDAVLDFLQKNKSIKTVILSAYWNSLMSGENFSSSGTNWRNAAAPSEESAAQFIQNGKNFISKVKQSGKKVIFMHDIPALDFDIKTCYSIRPLRFTRAKIRKNCSVNKKVYLARTQAQRTHIQAILDSFPGIRSYDPVTVLCRTDKCMATDGKLPYYLNGDHVNNHGASLIIDDFAKRFFPDVTAK